MAQKIIPAISLVVVSILAILFLTDSGTDRDVLAQTFHVDALYDSGHVEISFLDRHGKTDSVVMEILGMKTSFQKTFYDSEFVEVVPFPNLPKYGWPAHPVILDIYHKEFGHIQIKTEIHAPDEPAPAVIYSQP